jgi:hypothetical protein
VSNIGNIGYRIISLCLWNQNQGFGGAILRSIKRVNKCNALYLCSEIFLDPIFGEKLKNFSFNIENYFIGESTKKLIFL